MELVKVDGLDSVKNTELNNIVEVINDDANSSKLGLYFKQVVAEYKGEKLPTDTAKALLRIEGSLASPQNLEQLQSSMKRIEQIEKVCKILKADNQLFALKTAQIKERITMLIDQWKISMELTEAVRVA